MGNTYLLAGGNSGIGLETAKRLSSSGNRVICATRSTNQLDALDSVETVSFDASDEEAPTVDAESLDGFVYFPGTINLKPFHRTTTEEFLTDLQVNLLGAVNLLQANLPALKKADHASIVLFSTVAVQTGLPFHASIAAAKGAIEGLTRSLAAELAPTIRVNCLAPSLTDTPLAAPLLNSPEKAEASANRHPLKRVGDANEIAAAVEFLLGRDSGFISGQVIQIDGGLSTLKLF